MEKPKKMENPYLNANKLHLLLDSPTRALLKCKELFFEQLQNARFADFEYCVKNKIESPMNDKAFQDILDILQQCKDFFEVEALADYIFNLNEIPTYEQVVAKALRLKSTYSGLADHFKIK